MKTKEIFAVLASLILLAGCSDSDNAPEQETPSAVDTKPFKLEEYVDNSVHPGDNMYYYSYGKWLDAAKPEECICNYKEALKAKQARVTNTPESKNFLRVWDEYFASRRNGVTPDADSELCENLEKAMMSLASAAGMDDVIKIWARCIKEGYLTPYLITLGSSERGICVCPYASMFLETQSVTAGCGAEQSRAAAGMRCGVIDKLMTELGVSLEDVSYPSVTELEYIKTMDAMTAEALRNNIATRLSNLMSVANRSADSISVSKLMTGDMLYARFLDICEYDPIGLWATQQENDIVRQMIGDVREALIEHIGALDWMSSTTKSQAIEKVRAIVPVVVGAMDTRGQKVFGSMAAETLCASHIKKNKAMLNAALSLVGKPRTEENLYFAMEHFTIFCEGENLREMYNAYYDRVYNAIYICAPFGSFPVVDVTQTEAMLYGGVGFVVGHELTHSIDKGGASFGKYGTVENWWTDNDYQTFTERTQAVINSYGSMDALPEFFPSIKNNSAKTLNENIADIGGVGVALTAYKKRLAEQGFKGEEMDKCLRKFFITLSYPLVEKYDQAKAMKMLAKDDPHSLGSTRTGGMCRNCDEWYRIFGVELQHKLYLAPERRCRIW